MQTIIFDGRLTRDPETEVIPTGKECVKFTVANDKRKTKDEKQTNFFTCKAFGSTGAFVTKYFHKGAPINVQGELEIRSYEDKNGVKRQAITVYADKVWFTLGKGANQETVSSDQFTDINMEELPF